MSSASAPSRATAIRDTESARETTEVGAIANTDTAQVSTKVGGLQVESATEIAMVSVVTVDQTRFSTAGTTCALPRKMTVDPVRALEPPRTSR